MSKKLNILIVDDDEVQELLLRFKLQNYTCNIDYVNNAKSAIAKIEQNNTNYDLIISDIQMPIMSGLELAKYLRKVLKSEIILIAHTSTMYEQGHYQKQGFNALLPKGFYQEDFEKCLLSSGLRL